MVLQARTGSGKTLTYALPLISKLDPSRSSIQAIIVVPTRELGLQVTSVIKQLITGSPTPISIMTVVEGSKNRRYIVDFYWIPFILDFFVFVLAEIMRISM